MARQANRSGQPATGGTAGVLAGLRVLDLSWGIAGPITTMLLADQGADVVKIEPPGGDPFRQRLSGYRVWQRGKRSAICDLRSDAGRERFLALAADADVVVESYAPGTTERLGIDYPALGSHNERLVYCSITGYGRDNRHAGRPAYDALVQARTGLHWEQRGWIGGSINRLSGVEPFLPDLEVPDGCAEGPEREGPLFPTSTWPSLAAAYLATAGICAALRAREVTGRGQWVETSLLQGVLATTVGGWQRCENPAAPHYLTWVFDPRATKGEFRCADGRWVHHWVPNPNFVLGVSGGDQLSADARVAAPRDDPNRIATDPEEMVVLLHYQPQMAQAFARFPAAAWVEVGAQVGVALQPIRSPEEALADPALEEDGCVVEVDDPELGAIRHVGRAVRLHADPGGAIGPSPRPGEHTGSFMDAASAPQWAAPRRDAVTASPRARGLGSPLEGVRVLDLGLAVAGPFGTQVLGDLGAEVIKVNTVYDTYWHANHIAFACNRGKRSIAMNLKDPRAMEILHELVRGADVVQHNMRYEAAERLGVDYASLRAVNPRLVYCHTRGHDASRADQAGNDQTGAALAGVSYEDGGVARGGAPIWSLTSLGDTGNGFLSAIGIMLALYHRERTGEGQFVDTSIVNACLLNTSYAFLHGDGSPAARPRLDAEMTGLTALYRLYPAATGWLCLAVPDEARWKALGAALGRDDLAADPRFATAAAREAHDGELAGELAQAFATATAEEWVARLDAADVPAEVCSDQFALDLFDDPEMIERGWVTSYRHPAVGRLDQFGMLVDLSETKGVIAGPPLMVGADTRAICAEVGLPDELVEELLAERVLRAYEA